jgi:hypothetical protein
MGSIKKLRLKDGKLRYKIWVQRKGFPRVSKTFDSLAKAEKAMKELNAAITAKKENDWVESKKKEIS